MKIFRAYIALTLVFSFCLNAQQPKIDPAKLKHPVQACLFKVEGNGLQKPSWLFGTIHLGVPAVTTLHPRVEAAFNTADAVYTEIEMDPKAQIAIAPLMMRKDGKTLSQALGPELAGQLQDALKSIHPRLSMAAFEPTKTWVIAVTLPLLEMQLKNQTPLDAVLYQRAMREKKKVGALETAASQVGVFDQFSEKEIQAMLVDSIKTLKEDRTAEMDSVTKLLNIYLTGDVTAIAKFLKEEMEEMETDPEFNKRLIKALLDDRNIGMADKSHELMKADPGKSHFFAVGAAHYTGELAVQDLLEKKGYKITPTFQ